MGLILFENANLLAPPADHLVPGINVLVEGQRIREVSDRPIKVSEATRLDLAGRTLMPGLIDAHCHVTISEVNLHQLSAVPLTLMAARAGAALRAKLDRGFTTIRDAAGADWGLKMAVEEGLLVGPRMFVSGRALSQTGGHADFRLRTEGEAPCACSSGLHMQSAVADGVDAVIAAARNELRLGADQIKIMASGGVSSPDDPLEGVQYTPEEMRAVVAEAARRNTYVLAHAYSPAAILQAVEAGVRSIEHGNLINEAAAARLAEAGGFMVPTLVAYEGLKRRGRELGLSESSMVKLERVLQAGLASIEIARKAGVALGFGTDLLGPLQDMEALEFPIRAQIEPIAAVIASATVVNARLLGREGELGVVAPGALADILVLDGDPLRDAGLLGEAGDHLRLIMKGGAIHKNTLS
ncbi:MAG: amidohydrolase family protein [Caulobacteraceae bacterium]|nr:amidohydrolase family protein [Caulobacteraceae bacterium]